MDSSKTVTATFVQVQYTLTVNPSPANGGTITGGGAYASGAQVTVSATANSGYVFSNWSGACSGLLSCAVTMDSSKTVTANFSQQFTLTTLESPSTGGTVAPAGSTTHYSGSQMTVTVSVASGYTFTGWSGACSGTGSCLVTMDSNKTVTANFDQQFTLTTVAEPSTGGTVSPAGISSYDSGSQVTVTATAASGYSFGKWTGACTGTRPCIVTVDSNKTVTAVFNQVSSNDFSIDDPAEGGNPDFSNLLVRYSDDTAFDVTITLYSGTQKAGDFVYLYGTHNHMITFDSTSFNLKKDAGGDGHFEEQVYSGAVDNLSDDSIQMTIPAGLVPDIAGKRVWVYSMSSRDRTEDLMLTP